MTDRRRPAWSPCASLDALTRIWLITIAATITTPKPAVMASLVPMRNLNADMKPPKSKLVIRYPR
jgi:hypothetical protein